MSDALRTAIDDVVQNGNCSGCGACVLLSARVSMQLSDNGQLRPNVRPGSSDRSDEAEASLFRQVCPGSVVRAPRAAERQHEVFGRYVSAWEGWATDEEIRFAGSSAGVLTALSTWLVETGRTKAVLGSAASQDAPNRTVPVRIMSRDEALRSAGSRYAPVSNLERASFSREQNAIVAKPCEISGFSQLGDALNIPDEDRPVMLSFFCAGTPSQTATDSLIESLGIEVDEVRSLRYRGNGWPGGFVVESTDGKAASLGYDESWGRHLGRDLPWRCKLCVDGTGGHADISVGDFWKADPKGYPVFDDSPGRSVVIARTPRGHALLQQALLDGVITLVPLDLNEVANIQPLQVMRKRTLLGRLLGRRLAGRHTPRYPGFRLWQAALAEPLRSVKAMFGTFSRSRRRPH